MKKYTQPTVEITAFDFEDIMTTSSVANKSYAESGFVVSENPGAVEVTVTW